MKTLTLALILFATPAHAACTATMGTLEIFGDSRCAVGLFDGTKVGDYLQALCLNTTVLSSCRNGRGVFLPGQGTTDAPIDQLAFVIARDNPDAVILMLNINDWLTSVSIADEVDGLRDMGNLLVTNGILPIIATGWPVGDNSAPLRGAWTTEVQHAELALAAEMGWPSIDTAAAYDPRTYAACTVINGVPDLVHPYTASCRPPWAAYVAPRLP